MIGFERMQAVWIMLIGFEESCVLRVARSPMMHHIRRKYRVRSAQDFWRQGQKYTEKRQSLIRHIICFLIQ